MPHDPIVDLAQNVVNASFGQLPAEVVAFQKKRLLDTLGTCLAGSRAVGIDALRDYYQGMGGAPQSTVLVHGEKLPCANATMVNAVMCRAVDYCDTAPPGYHASSTDTPAVLAVGEITGASGKEVLTAMAAGGDLAHRITLAGIAGNKQASHPYFGFDGNIVGPFAAAAITGKLLGLSQEQMVDALGIALNQAAGTYQSNQDGALAVRVIQGFAAQAGVTAAMLAQRGITGVKEVLLGVYGFYALYTRGQVDVSLLTDGLGQTFYGQGQTIIKGYPSCGLTLAGTDAALAQLERGPFRPDQVARIEIRVSNFAYNVTGKAEFASAYPEIDAQFSLKYVVANVLRRGYPKLQHFTEAMIADPKVRELMAKIEVVQDDALVLDQTRITIHYTDGGQSETFAEQGKGFPANPISDQECLDKFHQCVEFAPVDIPASRAEEIIAAVGELEHMSNIKQLIELCVFGA